MTWTLEGPGNGDEETRSSSLLDTTSVSLEPGVFECYCMTSAFDVRVHVASVSFHFCQCVDLFGLACDC